MKRTELVAASCQLCQQTHQYCSLARHYQVLVCPDCQAANANGWQQTHEPRLLAGLNNNGLLIPDRTASGLLPFTYAPPSDYAL